MNAGTGRRWQIAHRELVSVADRYAGVRARQDPSAAAATGLPGSGVLAELGPAALDERLEAERDLRGRLRAVEPTTPQDWAQAPVSTRVLRDHLRERLDTSIDMIATGEQGAHLDTLASPFQRLRRTLLDVARGCGAHRPGTGSGPAAPGPQPDAVLAAAPQALEGLRSTLEESARRGVVAPRSQVLLAAGQAQDLARALGRVPSGAGGPAALAADRLATSLRQDLAPNAAQRQGVGPQRHALWVRRMLGTDLDPRETAAWVASELDEVVAAQDALAREVLGGVGPRLGQGARALDAHLRADACAALSPEQYVPWARGVADEAWEALVGTVIGVPQALGRPVVELDPPGGGVHYEEPDAAAGLPGRMLRSLADGERVLWPWAERTTVLHESVPGHHAHSGAQSVDTRLTLWQRHLARVPGCNEGWALYAEALSVEQGLVGTPAERFGWLSARRWRLARALIDLGVHAWLPVPRDVAALPGAARRGAPWDRDTVAAVLRAHTVLDEGFVRFEVDKQLGWPAQGLSYVVGERVWLAGRAAAAPGTAGKGLRAFHDRGIALGSVGLDLLARELGS